MKGKMAYVLAALAMLATSAASVGSWWFIAEEPENFNTITD